MSTLTEDADYVRRIVFRIEQLERENLELLRRTRCAEAELLAESSLRNKTPYEVERLVRTIAIKWRTEFNNASMTMDEMIAGALRELLLEASA